MPDDIKLTPKQEKFSQKYIELGNASEAYRQAYNAENMTDKQIWEEACKLNANPKVSQRVNELRQEHAKRHEVTVDSITAEQEEARKLAMKIKQPAAAAGASMNKAKLHGLVTDKSEVKITDAEKILEEIDGNSKGLPQEDVEQP